MLADLALMTKVAELLGGENAVKVVKALAELGKATDDQLSVRLKIDLNEVRKLLYTFYACSLVTVERTRDENTGWFTFYWKLQPDAVEGFISSQKRKVLEKLKIRLEFERSHDFYICTSPECSQRLTFDDATELLFRCPICGSPLDHFDNGPVIEALNERIKRIEEEISP
jgi:transcription initiation factor TFIIE subunit alpha